MQSFRLLFNLNVKNETIVHRVTKMQIRVKENVDEIGKCGCGRSPTGKCIGWHGLSESEFQSRLAAFLAEEANSVKDSTQGG
jgi:hypothetical protein